MDGWVEDATVEPLSAAVQQLTEYFAGARREFDLPLRLRGHAPSSSACGAS